MTNWKKCVSTMVAALAISSMSFAEQNNQDNKNSSEQETATNRDNLVSTAVVTTYSSGIRASKLIGMEVRNQEGNQLGEITDLVMDRYGQVRYAAMSRGGVLGIGNKLFAVPFCCATIKADQDSEEHFVMFDVDEKTLEESPGFEEDNWPAVGTASYWLTIDQHYADDVKRNQESKQNEQKQNEKKQKSNQQAKRSETTTR